MAVYSNKEKCERSIVYEQMGSRKLVVCDNIGECPYNPFNRGAEKFTSSENEREYSVCRTNGLIIKIEN
ncbi:MAG: hypothetical protein Q7S33_02545 [Nanoarchaeota archaeon]|nr:hypothetical protein [Nanoarchaeota archaeon]